MKKRHFKIGALPGVHSGEGVVQQVDIQVRVERSGQVDPLPLPAGQGHSTLTNQRHVAVAQDLIEQQNRCQIFAYPIYKNVIQLLDTFRIGFRTVTPKTVMAKKIVFVQKLTVARNKAKCRLENRIKNVIKVFLKVPKNWI